MPFLTISCHVWAIDGYHDDPTADGVNQQYTAITNTLRGTGAVQNSLVSRNAALVQIINSARSSAIVQPQQHTIIYGGFRRGQAGPEHMWLEYNGFIYETMPNFELYAYPVSPARQQCPGLENEAFGQGGVASCPSHLTVRQQAYIAANHAAAVALGNTR